MAESQDVIERDEDQGMDEDSDTADTATDGA